MNKDFDNIDDMARGAFQNFEVDFNPEDWKRMEAKLDKKEHRFSHIWLFKGIEALVLMLIIVTTVNFLSIQNDANNPLSEESSVEKELINLPDNNLTVKELSTNETDNLSKNNETGNTTNSTTTTKLPTASTENESGKATMPLNNAGNAKTQGLNNNITKNNKAANTQDFANNTNSTTQKTSPTFVASDKKTDLGEGKMIAETPLSNKTSTLTNLDVNNTSTTNELTGNWQNNTASISFIMPVDITKTVISDHNGGGGGKEEGTAIKIESSFKLPKIYHRQLRLGVYSGAEVNLPNLMGSTRLGAAFGLLIENEISDRFAIRGGFVISRKNYEDNYITFIDRTATEGIIYRSEIYKKTTLGTIQIPIALNCIAYRDSKWKLSFNAGVAAQLLTNRYVSGTQRTTVYQQAGGMVSVSEINPNAQEKGAWQGGNMKTNAYFLATMGFELERRLGDRVSIFLQPVYQHAFTRVGDAQDFIHTISMNVGLKTIIK